MPGLGSGLRLAQDKRYSTRVSSFAASSVQSPQISLPVQNPGLQPPDKISAKREMDLPALHNCLIKTGSSQAEVYLFPKFSSA